MGVASIDGGGTVCVQNAQLPQPSEAVRGSIGPQVAQFAVNDGQLRLESDGAAGLVLVRAGALQGQMPVFASGYKTIVRNINPNLISLLCCGSVISGAHLFVVSLALK